MESVTAVDSTSGQLMQLVVDHTTGEVSRCVNSHPNHLLYSLIANDCASSRTFDCKRMQMKRAANYPCAFAKFWCPQVHPLLEYVEGGEEILQIEESLMMGDEEADGELSDSSDAELGYGSDGDERLLSGDVESGAGSGESGVDDESQDGENGKAHGSDAEDK